MNWPVPVSDISRSLGTIIASDVGVRVKSTPCLKVQERYTRIKAGLVFEVTMYFSNLKQREHGLWKTMTAVGKGSDLDDPFLA